jgi:hypothetical protein
MRNLLRTLLAGAGLAAVLSAPAYATTIYEGLFSAAPTGGNIPYADGTTPGQLDASSLSDNGSSVTGTEPINATLVVSVANAGTTGTTANALAKLNSSGNAVITATTDASGAIGVVVLGAGTSGNAMIAKEGTVTCAFDGATTAGDYVQISSTTDGDCHDTGASTYPTSGQVLGRALSTNGSAGSYSILLGPGAIGSSSGGTPGGSNTQAQFNNSGSFGGSSGLTLTTTRVTGLTFSLGSDATGDLYYNSGSGVLARLGIGSTNQVLTVSGGLPSWQTPPGGGNVSTSGSLTSNVIPKAAGSASIGNSSITDNGTAVTTSEPIGATVVNSIANASSTGTTVNTLTKLTAGNAVIAATTDTSGMIGITVSGAGTSGNALVAVSGLVSCAFDGTATAGDYVQISSSTAGDCHDTGSIYPSSNQVIGRVQSGGSGASNYTVLLFSPGITASSGGSGASCPSGFTLSSTTGECYWTVTPATNSTNCASSTAACIYWTGLTLNEYRVACYGILAGASNKPEFQFGEGSSPTYEVASYHWAYTQTHSSGTGQSGSESDSGIVHQGMPTSGSAGWSAQFRAHGLQQSGYKTMMGETTTYVASTTYITNGGGQYQGDTNAITAIRLVDYQSTPTSLSGGYCTLYVDSN